MSPVEFRALRPTALVLLAALIPPLAIPHPAVGQERAVQKARRSYYYQVWGTSSQAADQERPWSESYDGEGTAQERLAEIKRDHAKGGLLESSPDKPTGLHIRKIPRVTGAAVRSKEELKAVSKRLTGPQRRAHYLPDNGTTRCSEFVRDFVKEVLGHDLRELEGLANQQIDRLKNSAAVERIWSPDGHEADLAASRQALQDARRLEAERKQAEKLHQGAQAVQLAGQIREAQDRATEKAQGLVQAFQTAQALADQGEVVLVGWKNPQEGGHGHIAVVDPREDDSLELRRSGDWGGMRVPFITQAGRDVFADRPLSYGFKSVESIEGLSIFVLPAE